MASQYEDIVQLTSESTSDVERLRCLNSFANQLGWRPSDRIDEPLTRDIATIHLLVEHGLENTAVITFLRRGRVFTEIDLEQQIRLLSLSYNNLVDWHVVVEAEAVNHVYVRTRVPTIVERSRLDRHTVEKVRSEVFEQIIERRPNPNIPPLDDALIRTISYWKRNLAAETSFRASNEQLSVLFNALMFARAVEDLENRKQSRRADPVLLHHASERGVTLREVISASFVQLIGALPSDRLIDFSKLRVFDKLPPTLIKSLISEFYENRFAPYRYDFCVMSKHALSRIYEHYVSVLSVEETPQLSFLAPLPDESLNKATGAIYTPHYIARFFVRFLRENLPQAAFRTLRTIDPACGSGMFLRTLLEAQAELLQATMDPNIGAIFDRAIGVDLDPNAVQATRLSLALLYLAVTGDMPSPLNILNEDALQLEDDHPEFIAAVDAVLMNPPFVSLDTQSTDTRKKLVKFMGDKASGRLDLYMAFLSLSISLLREGGVGCYVLPHSFLLSKNAAGIRQAAAEQCWIRTLVDLSAINVFGSTGIYVILMIVQKKVKGITPPSAVVVRVSDQPGKALQAAIDGQRRESATYSIYDVTQDEFTAAPWLLLPPSENLLRRKMEDLPPISDYLEIRQGIVTGADDIFILPTEYISEDEEDVFMPFLRDRDMETYSVPKRSSHMVFHPFKGTTRLTETELRKDFPKTWKHLTQHKSQLQNRKSIEKYGRLWWEPMWPRPDLVHRKKLLAPHLVLMPRFSCDLVGQFAISRGPVLVARESGASEDVLLKYFCAVLNSAACYWHVARHSHTYRRGYVMLEPKTLRATPVPKPELVPPAVLRKITKLVDGARIREDADAAAELDRVVSDLYRLTNEERRLIGVES